jgi:hypothetical protein
VSGPIEHASYARAGLHVIDPELQPHGDGSACAGEPRLHGDQRLDGDLAEVELEVGMTLIAVEKIPVRDVLVLGEPSLLAARDELERSTQELARVLGRYSHLRVPLVRMHRADVIEREREVRDHVEPLTVGLEDARSVGAHQVVEHAVRVPSERNALHGVGQVPVERREEAKAMLAGKPSAAGSGGAGNEDASRLAALRVLALVDRHAEAALRQLVRRAHSADAAAQHCDRRRSPAVSHRRGILQNAPSAQVMTQQRGRKASVSYVAQL